MFLGHEKKMCHAQNANLQLNGVFFSLRFYFLLSLNLSSSSSLVIIILINYDKDLNKYKRLV